MKKSDIVIGRVYVMKVSGKLHPVRVEEVCAYGGWSGTNLDTGRTVRIRTATKLRKEWPKQTVASTDIPLDLLKNSDSKGNAARLSAALSPTVVPPPYPSSHAPRIA